jgi:hypothetical protein
VATGPGNRVAAPGRRAATDTTAYTHGTSNATALVTRQANRIFDDLEAGADDADDIPFPDALFHPVLTKDELGHVVLGDEYSSDLGGHASRADGEAVINAFAAEFLLPSAVIGGRGQAVHRSTLISLAATYRTSWSLAVRQAVQAGVLDGGDARRWLPQTPTRAELLDAIGWTRNQIWNGSGVPPSYAHAVLEARSRHQITTARAVELMRGQIEEADFPPLVEEDAEP